jgi:hypothetical protein
VSISPGFDDLGFVPTAEIDANFAQGGREGELFLSILEVSRFRFFVEELCALPLATPLGRDRGFRGTRGATWRSGYATVCKSAYSRAVLGGRVRISALLLGLPRPSILSGTNPSRPVLGGSVANPVARDPVCSAADWAVSAQIRTSGRS